MGKPRLRVAQVLECVCDVLRTHSLRERGRINWRAKPNQLVACIRESKANEEEEENSGAIRKARLSNGRVKWRD